MFKVFDLLNGSRITRSYAEKALGQGVTAIHITVNNFSTVNPLPTLRESLTELAAVRRYYAGLEGIVRVIERKADFDAAQQDGKLGVVFGYQNLPGIGTDLSMLELFHALGVRVIQIAHNVRGPFADGCAEPADAGLSTLGREFVAELNRLGIVVDLSHTGDRSSIEAIEMSKHPVAITHANALAICRNVRNKSDAALKALRRNGGVIGVCYLPPIVRMGTKPSHADVIEHVRHIRSVAGAESIAIGSDFITDQPAERYQEFMKKPEVYGTWPWLFPVSDVIDQQELLAELRGSDFTDREIEGIASGNAKRVFQAVLA